MRRGPLTLMLAVLVPPSGCVDSPDPVSEVPAIEWCEQASGWDSAAAGFELEVLALINEQRAAGADCVGGGEFLTPAEPLTMVSALRCAARRHTLAMIAADSVTHESPTGETYEDRAGLAEYTGEPLAQSIAAGPGEPAQVVAAWLSHDGNCANLMNPDATELGVGYLPASGVKYGDYWTLVFGRRD